MVVGRAGGGRRGLTGENIFEAETVLLRLGVGGLLAVAVIVEVIETEDNGLAVTEDGIVGMSLL